MAMQTLKKAAQRARGWVARERPAGAVGGSPMLVAVLRQGLDWAYNKAVDGVPGLDGAASLAARYAARHSDADAAVAALIARQTGLAGATGFVTGIGGFVALPAALPANLASALYIQARLIAAIAHLRGHDVRSDEVRTLALACLTGSRAADTLKDAGVRFGTRLARDGLGSVAPVVFRKVQHAASVPAVCAAGNTTARLVGFVPLVGGAVAGGFDAAMTAMIGRTADRVFRRPMTGQNTI